MKKLTREDFENLKPGMSIIKIDSSGMAGDCHIKAERLVFVSTYNNNNRLIFENSRGNLVSISIHFDVPNCYFGGEYNSKEIGKELIRLHQEAIEDIIKDYGVDGKMTEEEFIESVRKYAATLNRPIEDQDVVDVYGVDYDEAERVIQLIKE